MSKTKLIIAILLLSLVLSLFAGCQAQNGNVSNNEGTEPSSNVTEPSGEVTEPSKDVTDPTETVCPRTVEHFKSHLTPYMTYGEAKEIFGSPDWTNDSSLLRFVQWNLEDGCRVSVHFFPIANERFSEYLATAPTEDGTVDEFLSYHAQWNNHMEAYIAELWKAGSSEPIEVWFDYGNGPFDLNNQSTP